MTEYLWQTDVDAFVRDLKEQPTFPEALKTQLKAEFKACAQQFTTQLATGTDNIQLVQDLFFAEKKLNLILFCFAYDYDLTKVGLEQVLEKDGAEMYWQGMVYRNFDFESNTFLAKC